MKDVRQQDEDISAQQYRLPSVRPVVFFTLAAFVVVTPLADSWLKLGLLVLGAVTLLAVSLPHLVERVHPLSPLTWIFILTFFGVALKLLYIVVVGFDHPWVVARLLQNRNPIALAYGAVAMAVGLVCLIVGYVAHGPIQRAVRIPHVLRGDVWSRGALKLAVQGVALVSLMAMVLFIQRAGVGFGSLAAFSAKRFNDLDGGSSSRVTEPTYLMLRVALLARFGLYFALVARWLNGWRHGFRLSTWTCFVVAILMPLMISNRAGAVLVILDLFLLRFFAGLRINKSQLLAGGTVAIATVVGLLGVRSTFGNNGVSELVERTFFGRDFMDVTKTAHVVTIPEVAPLQGETLYGWLFALLPPTVEWKPLWTGLGQYVFRNGYGGRGVTGIPAGLVGELYLNLWWPGVIVGMIAWGWCLRWVWERVYLTLPYRNGKIIGAIVIWRLTVFSLANDLGTGILKAGLDLIPLLLIMMFVTRRTQVEDDAAPPLGQQHGHPR